MSSDNGMVTESTQRVDEYAQFFERNKDGITHADIDTRTYYVRRMWTLKGPIPKGIQIQHVGLAKQRRVGKVKRRKW